MMFKNLKRKLWKNLCRTMEVYEINMEDLKQNPILNQLLTKQMIDRVLFLDNNRKIQLGYSKQTAKQVV